MPSSSARLSSSARASKPSTAPLLLPRIQAISYVGASIPPYLSSDLLGRSHEDVPSCEASPPSALPAFLHPMCASSLVRPSCIQCSLLMQWSEWRAHCVCFPLGRGLYAASCAACRRKGASNEIKDDVGTV